MKLEEVFRFTFKAIRREIGPSRFNPDFVMPSMKMIDACRADDFSFFQPFIAAGRLTIAYSVETCINFIRTMFPDLCEDLDSSTLKNLRVTSTTEKIHIDEPGNDGISFHIPE